MIINKVTGVGAAMLLVASVLFVNSIYAEEADKDRVRSQDQLRDEVNLQDPVKDQAQDRVRDQDQLREHLQDGSMEKEKNQYRNEYKYRENTQTQQKRPVSGSMAR